MEFYLRGNRGILMRGLLLGVCFTGLLSGSAPPRFYADDPIAEEPETQDASNAKPWDIDLLWDLSLNLFAQPGDPTPNVKAKNVNTIDEVPDSGWFTNRILTRILSDEELRRGPQTGSGPADGPWTVIKAKQAGFAPGFTMKDSRGDTWFVSLDAKDHPEAATGAIMAANKIFWALGYFQVENYLIGIRPEALRISGDATIKMPNGNPRPFRRSDLDDVFRRAQVGSDGVYRAVAGKALPGKVLGGFKYVDTRPDDPNDVVLHEHRRELRALKVFGAWTNLVDLKADNTLDVLIPKDGKKVIRHYLQDVGSTFGTGAIAPHDYAEGFESLYEAPPLIKRLVTFGFFIQPWQTAHYEKNSAIGRFESTAFNPEEWKPRVPNAAFLRARPDDDFWAARRVMAFSDEMIRTIAKTAQFRDPSATELLADTLIARRDKIGKAYLTSVNPLVDLALSPSNELTFGNTAVSSGLAAPPEYSIDWYTFDNNTRECRFLGNTSVAHGQPALAPLSVKPVENGYIRVRIAMMDKVSLLPLPLDAYFRRSSGSWKLVGLERMP
jgi:hypothetical protein